MMTAQELFDRMRAIQAADVELCEAKNHDYGASEDPLYNLRPFGLMGVVVRLSDKMARLVQYTKKGSFAVRGEGVRDTLRDIRNYCLLAEVMLDEADGATGQKP